MDELSDSRELIETKVSTKIENNSADLQIISVKQEIPVVPVELHEVNTQGDMDHEGEDNTPVNQGKEENKSTVRQTGNAVRTFRLWLRERNLSVNFENMTDEELDQALTKYYPEIRQENGDRYQKSSLIAMRHGLNRYIMSKMGREITKDANFSASQRVFKAVCKNLKKYGKDNVAHYPPIAKNDWVRMCKYFKDGKVAPNVRLLQKVYVDLMMFFGKMIRQDFHQLGQDDFEMKYDEQGKLYLTHSVTYKCGKMYAREGDPLCPVKSFMEYLSHLHPETTRLFLRPIQGNLKVCWYSNNPLGLKPLSAIMKEISMTAGLSRLYTTHSLRVTDRPNISTQAMEAMLKVLDEEVVGSPASCDSDSDKDPPSTGPKHVACQKRFGNISDSDLDLTGTDCLSDNDKTQRSNIGAAKQLRIFLKSIGKDENFPDYEMSELNEVLIKFFQNARKEDGDMYKVSTLKSFHFGLNRYLKGQPHCKNYDLRFHPAFKTSYETLKSICTEYGVVTEEGIKYNPIPERDLHKLYASPLLSTDTPKGLFNKVQFELRLLVCGSIFEKFHTMEKDYFIVAKDELSKIRYVRNNSKKSSLLVKESFMYEMLGSPYCPVASFELYLQKLNPGCNYLWQHSLPRANPDNQRWYTDLPCGEKMMSKFMTKLSQACKLSQVYTNRHIRATDPNVLVKVLNKLDKARVVLVHNPVITAPKKASGKQDDDDSTSVKIPVPQSSSSQDLVVNISQPSTAQLPKQSMVSILPNGKNFEIDPEWKKQLQSLDLSQVSKQNSVMLVPVKVSDKKDSEKKKPAKQALSAKIMAQYRQIACKKSADTGTVKTIAPVVNVSSTPYKNWSSVDTHVTVSSSDVISSNQSVALQSPIEIKSTGHKRAAVERPVTRALCKKSKVDTSNDSNRLKSIKIGNQIVFFGNRTKTSENHKPIFSSPSKILQFKLPVKLQKSSSSNQESNELEQNSTDLKQTSDIKIEIVDDSYDAASGCDIECDRESSTQDIDRAQTDISKSMETSTTAPETSTNDDEFPLLMEVEDHVSVSGDSEMSDDEVEDEVTETKGTEAVSRESSNDVISSVSIKQEPEEDSQPQLYIVPGNPIQYPTSEPLEEPPTPPVKQERDTLDIPMEPHSLRSVLTMPPIEVQNSASGQLNSGCNGSSFVIKEKMKCFLNRIQSNDSSSESSDTIFAENVQVPETSNSSPLNTNIQEKMKRFLKKRNPQQFVNSFSELMASVNTVSGYQMFLLSKALIRPSTDSSRKPLFSEAICNIDNEWGELDKKTRAWYGSCAKTLRRTKLIEKEVQTERPMCMPKNDSDFGSIPKKSMSSRPCTDCKVQAELYQKETRIQELEKQLEQANSKNKELVNLALNLKGQLQLKIKDLTN